MATNEPPDLLKKPLAKHVNSDALLASAKKAAAILAFLPELRVWIVHCKAPDYKDNSWFIGLTDSNDPLLLNIRISPSNLIIEFRFPQYLPSATLDTLKWTCASWAYANYNICGEANVVTMIRSYLAAILSDYYSGKVKAGGRSIAEKLIRRHLESIFPGTTISPNYRSEHFLSPKGRPLEFDLWIPDCKLAIEVQGPQHFKPLYGDDNTTLKANDQVKREWCKLHEIKLVWIEWDGATKSLFRLPEVEQRRHLNELLKSFIKSDSSFLWWRSTVNYEFV